MNEHKIARAVEECLALMDCGPYAAAVVSEMEYIGLLEADPTWTRDEIEVVRQWVKKAIDQRRQS